MKKLYLCPSRRKNLPNNYSGEMSWMHEMAQKPWWNVDLFMNWVPFVGVFYGLEYGCVWICCKPAAFLVLNVP